MPTSIGSWCGGTDLGSSCGGCSCRSCHSCCRCCIGTEALEKAAVADALGDCCSPTGEPPEFLKMGGAERLCVLALCIPLGVGAASSAGRTCGSAYRGVV